MSLKSTLFASGLLLASTMASASTPITLTNTGPNQWSGSFAAMASGINNFTLDLSSLAGWNNISVNTVVTANFSGGSGYDVTAVAFDGNSYTPAVNISVPGVFGADAWTYAASNLSASAHTLDITGTLLGGSVGFTGSISITAQPVPEPETYALLLAGLGIVGWVARRRSR
jgi:PEP-CTERM motif